MAAATDDFVGLVVALDAAGVEFVLVGGLAAVALGAPVGTLDVDIVQRRTPENVERLVAALATLDARYGGRPEDQVLRPAAPALAGPGHHWLLTRLGPLDVLGTVGAGKTYDDLVAQAVGIELRGRRIRVASLETLIALKQHAGREKDRAVLPLLRAVLAKTRSGR